MRLARSLRQRIRGTKSALTRHELEVRRHGIRPTVGAVSDVTRRQLALYAVAGVLVVVLGARWVGTRPPASETIGGAATARARPATGAGAPDGVALTPPPGGRSAVVHVAGEVREPGVYRLRRGTRVEDAVRRAGGPTREGDVDALNLAAKVGDGRQVIVPRRVPRAQAAAGGPSAAASSTSAGGATAPPAGGLGGAPPAPVNLNTATEAELGTLDGVGPATARKILAFRQERGGFASVDELDAVPGIGAKRLATLRPLVTV